MPKRTKPRPSSDPTRTTGIRNAMLRDTQRRINALKREIRTVVGSEDTFGLNPANLANPVDAGGGIRLNARYTFATDAQKLAAFRQWFADAVAKGILSIPAGSAPPDKPWMAEYVESAYRRGMLNAYIASKEVEGFRLPDDMLGKSQADFLRDAFGQPEAVAKVQFLATRTYNDLKGVSDYMANQMNRTMAQAIADGLGAEDAARRLFETIDGISAARARMVARTELIAAHAEGQLDAFQKLGVTELGVDVELATAGDKRVCSICAALEGTVYTVESARGVIPVHPNCVVGSSRIDAPGTLAVLRAKYTGEIVHIRTTSGRLLSVTANHVLLTKAGFITANLLNPGDQLVDASRLDSVSERPNDVTGKSSISDGFTALAESREMLSVRVPVTAEDLHGEGRSCHPEIDVVYADSELRNEFNSTRGQLCEHHALVLAHSRLRVRVLNTVGVLALTLDSAARSSDSSMGRFRDTLALLLGCLRHSDKHGFGAVARLTSHLQQLSVDGLSADFVAFRECLRAHPTLKEFDDLFDGEVRTARFEMIDYFNSGAYKNSGDRFVRDVLQFGDGGDSHSISVEFDDVRSVEVVLVHELDVFDVVTSTTAYRLNGIVSSNCRCSFIPSFGKAINSEINKGLKK